MKVILNSRLVTPPIRVSAEQLVRDHSVRPRYLLISYRYDASPESVLEVQPEDDPPAVVEDIPQMRWEMEKAISKLRDIRGQHNAPDLIKEDARIWTSYPSDSEPLDGLEVRCYIAGPPAQGSDVVQSFPGTLACEENSHGKFSVRLTTDIPLEDANGREVYHVELDQSSVDSIAMDRRGDWAIRLPDHFSIAG